MPFTVRAQEIIDGARARHWAFAELSAGDGAALLYLRQRLRTHLAQHGAQIEGLVGTSLRYTIALIAGLLVAEDALGNPSYTTTYQDGWPIHLDAFGNPYYDTSEPMIAADPFGLHGGTPGFPLPNDMVRLTEVILEYNGPTGLLLPCDVIPEAGRLVKMPGRNPQAFVSGNRLVPNFPFYPSPASTNSGDRWFSVTGLQMAYVALPTLAALTDLLNLPGVLAEALVADLAVYFAFQAKALSQGERVAFQAVASEARAMIAAGSLDLLNEPEQSTVHYTG